MSEERRISLAELLAREGGAPAAPTGGRRRRHRGGENSITVAELTGEIPVVRDDQPAPGEQAPTDAPQAEVAAAEVAELEVVEPEIVEPEVVEAEFDGAQTPEPAAAPEPADDEPITSSFLAAAVAAPGPVDEPEARADEAPVHEAGEYEAIEYEAEVYEVTADEHAEPETPAPAPRRGLLRWGRGARAEARQEHGAPAPEEAHAAEPEPGPEVAAAQSEDGTDYAWSRWDQAEAPIMATADFNTAQVRERQSRFAEIEAEPTVDVKPVAVPDGDGGVPSAPDTASMSAQQIEEARAAGNPDFLDQPGEGVEDAAEKAPSAGKGRGWLALAAEVVLGLVAGAGLFYGFFKLWNWGGGWPTIALTVVLAFVVIIGIVTFTHYLRKTTDYLTLGLALFVGLVITFGPLLMALGSN